MLAPLRATVFRVEKKSFSPDRDVRYYFSGQYALTIHRPLPTPGGISSVQRRMTRGLLLADLSVAPGTASGFWGSDNRQPGATSISATWARIRPSREKV